MSLKGTTIGRKDVRLQLQKLTTTLHARTNEEVKTYTTFAHVWAEELGPVSNERYEAAQQVAQNISRFRIRHSHKVESNLNEMCRIIRGDDTLEVSGVEKIGRKTEYVITAGLRDNG